MKNNHLISRKDMVQNLALATAGIGLFNLFGCQPTQPPITNTTKLLSPLFLPPQLPLEPGPAGLDIRTWVRSSKTNMQFSCVETSVAPKKMGPAPHVHEALDEIMLVVEGTATVWMDGKVQEIPVGAGI